MKADIGEEKTKNTVSAKMQARISSSHISKCSLAFKITSNNVDPNTGNEYSYEDIVKGYLFSHEVISSNDYVLALEILGFDEVKQILER